MDSEKVIKNIERCNEDGLCIDCEYNQHMACKHFLLRDTLAMLKEQKEQIKNRDESLEKAREEIKWLRGMLKEQEAVDPIYVENPYTHLPVSHCPKCKEPINQYITGNPYRKTEYCHYCGQAVKWE